LGLGFQKRARRSCFSHSPKIDASMSREKGGTGLGLAIAKGIIRAHNGKIWVESAQGKGSSFYFSIPIRQKVREKEVPYICDSN